MTLAKAVVTGSVYRTPEIRYTKNNMIEVSSFVINIGDKEEMLLRVIARRTSLSEIVKSISKDDRVLVEGNLQIETAKNENGAERRFYEIDAVTIEKMGAGSGPVPVASNDTKEDIVKFASEEFTDELIGEDEIPF